ncbi:MAG TPA: VWA domain-containing protein [Pyrinomonadaceae bacterium]|nr:VWA domain-containing protein [Pyrinomonadaceae bacterium]
MTRRAFPRRFAWRSLFLFVGLCASLCGAPSTIQGQSQEPIDTIKIDTNLISVPVIVSDRENRYVRDLKIEAFKLFDNQVEQKIAVFDTGEEPLNVVLMLDTSLSTSGVLDDIKKAAKAFLKELRPQDRAMIVTFDWQEQKLTTLTSNRKELESGIKQAQVGKMAGTVLYDSLMDVSSRVLQPIRGRKAIILLSDGNDHGSVVNPEDLLRSESEADAMIYSIYYLPEGLRFLGPPRPMRFPFPRRFDSTTPQRPRGPGGGQGGRRGGRRGLGYDGHDLMEKLSEVTGGRFYEGETKNLKETFALIAEELRHQYRLGFYPDELKRDGSVHALSVKVDLPDVSVRSRREYLAK